MISKGEKKNTALPTSEKVKEIFKVKDETFFLYTTYEDPISGKISDNDRSEIIQNSKKDGEEIADQVIQEYPGKNINELINLYNVHLEIDSKKSKTKFLYFATYEEGSIITLYKGNIEESAKLITDIDIPHLTIELIYEIILAHELFHYFEEIYPDLYTNCKRIPLWNLGRFKRESNIICASEIGAMAFAKRLLDLSFNSHAINYILYSAIDKKSSEIYYDKILQLDKNIK